MSKYFITACWGFLISALGAIPLGVLNITAMQVALNHGAAPAWAFAIGVALVEVGYARLLLSGLRRLMAYSRWLRWLDLLAIAIISALAGSAVYAALHPEAQTASTLLPTGLGAAFVAGMAMSAANPMQLPYWFGWSAVLLAKGRLHAETQSFNWYTFGIGLGTLAGLGLFVLGGTLLAGRFSQAQYWINWAIAAILVVTALLLAVRLWQGKGTATKLEQATQKQHTTTELHD